VSVEHGKLPLFSWSYSFVSFVFSDHTLSLRAVFDLPRLEQEWFSNINKDLLAGVAVALALIPEAIAFSLIAGVEPKVGLYASFTIAVMAALFGGRPGMISGATGAMALLMVPLVAKHGIEYLFAATILTGVVQVVFRILRFTPRV